MFFFIIGNTYTILSSIVLPTIVRIFYKMQPLPEGEMRDNLLQFITERGIKVHEIYEVDSGMGGAAISGFGEQKNLFLSKKIIDTHNLNEIEALVAHELGHKMHLHLEKELLIRVVLSAISCYLLNLTYIQGVSWLGISITSIEGIPLLYLLWQVLNKITEPIGLYFSRLMEREADRYAIEVIPDPQSLVEALKKDFTGNPSPSFLTYIFRYAHPRMEECIKVYRR